MKLQMMNASGTDMDPQGQLTQDMLITNNSEGASKPLAVKMKIAYTPAMGQAFSDTKI
eukprot:CAMPEP_0116882322 /NCGR_PEP_ID=MMETSP0463-20121206/14522_1 /TAXON_ID=181622 /ORGANISM="Strombidinopsis sp, Strain SopsisLIS2011" /LENGTH=57 /DNA_ID=CAMNT_0004535327 /DNA_START=2389 /DNA_END=2559 /DNA_ORIENTATION=+